MKKIKNKIWSLHVDYGMDVKTWIADGLNINLVPVIGAPISTEDYLNNFGNKILMNRHKGQYVIYIALWAQDGMFNPTKEKLLFFKTKIEANKKVHQLKKQLIKKIIIKKEHYISTL
jgi:hypothetical protein